jgi:hypothetical protein
MPVLVQYRDKYITPQQRDKELMREAIPIVKEQLVKRVDEKILAEAVSELEREYNNDGYEPKTGAERMREYRRRKKLGEIGKLGRPSVKRAPNT